jgi:ubiquinol-cytochrome c reductase iron-sulfur subunit
MERKLLTRSVIVLSTLGLVITGYVFVSSLSPSERAKAESEHLINITGLMPGELRVVNVNERPLFIHRATKQEHDDLRLLDNHVWNKDYSGYDEKQDIFVFWGLSTRLGCHLTHLPKGKSRFENNGAVWMGGYFDPCHDSSYDYAGRTIKTIMYTVIGFNAEVPNLKPPRFEASMNHIFVHGYER